MMYGNAGELKVKPEYGHDGTYGDYGRWPLEERKYESGLIGGQQGRAQSLSTLLTSTDPMDRVRAAIYIREFRVTVPAFVVCETPESPNLFHWAGIKGETPSEEYRAQKIAGRTAWSAHLDEADAERWRARYQQLHDADLERHPWWGPNSKRIFGVEFWDNAPINALRQHGADPVRHIHAFR